MAGKETFNMWGITTAGILVAAVLKTAELIATIGHINLMWLLGLMQVGMCLVVAFFSAQKCAEVEKQRTRNQEAPAKAAATR